MSRHSTHRSQPSIALVALIVAAASFANAQVKPPQPPATKPAAAKKLPVIEAGTIIGEFASDYDAAGEKYAGQDFTLKGRVEKTSVRKVKDRTFVRLYLAPSEEGSTSMVSIWIDFPEKMADEVSKLKAGDLALVDCSYLEFPASAPIIHELRGFTGAKTHTAGADDKLAKTRDGLVDWIKTNNSLKPEPAGADKLLADQTQKIEAALNAGDDFSITFSPDLVTSKKLTILALQDGKMLPVQLTDEQAKQFKLPALSAVFRANGSDAFRMPPEVEISKLDLTGAPQWNMTQHLRGTVKVKNLISHEGVPAEYGLRMICYSTKKRTVFYHTFHGSLGDVTYNLEFAALDWEIKDLNLDTEPAPHVVFFEVVRRIGEERFESDKPEPQYEIISDPTPMVLNLTAK